MESDTLSPFPSHDPIRDGIILDRYFSGESDHVEQAIVEEWIRRTPGIDTRIAAFRYVTEAHSIGSSAYDSRQVWGSLRTRIHSQERGERARLLGPKGHEGRADGRRTIPWLWNWGSGSGRYVLGSILTAVLVFAAAWHLEIPGRTSASLPVSVYTTGPGERATVLLADSTTVILNVASRLEVPIDYASGNRSVHLRGEALFTVSHHRGAPFTVSAGSSTTRVLGTTFAVRHYETDRVARVTVRDGKVMTQDVVLIAQQQADIDSSGAPIVRTLEHDQFSFATGVLLLTRMPLPDAIVELNRWYNADIRIGDPQLASRDIHGEFVAGSLVELTDILRLAFDIRVVREGRKLTLYAK